MVDLINLPFPFEVGPPPVEDNYWNWNPDEHEDNAAQREELQVVHNALVALIAEGLTNDDLLRVWIDRRASPLQKRTHKMCHMSEAMDPNHISMFVLLKESIYCRVKAIACTSMKSTNWKWGKMPYDRQNQVPVVSI